MSRTQTDSEVLRYALRYAERGIRVFPVQPGGKGPYHKLIDSWTEEASTDADQIRQWFGSHPEANLGAATGEWAEDTPLLVVDIDVPGGYETWKALRGENDQNPPRETLTVQTPSGGRHLYYTTKTGVPIKSAKDTLGDSVDTKGHGGYVVAPPSTVDSGQYAFDGDQTMIAPAPRWLISAARKRLSETDEEQETRGRRDTWTESMVEDALSAIPPQPGYDQWIRIIAAVKDAAPDDATAARLLEQWSPEKNGDHSYEQKIDQAADDKITAGTLVHHARQHGWTHPANREDQSSSSAAPAGDGQAGQTPQKPHPADQHPDEWYEDDPTGYSDTGKDEEDTVTLDDLHIESVPELLEADIRPPEPLVTYDGRALLHEGTSQLVAKPKIGKTNLAMNLGLAIASDNGVALGNATVQRHGGVLMLNLDGSRRGSYGRFQTMCQEGDPPERFDVLHGQFPEVAPNEDGGALDLLGEYLGKNPDTELVIVDTLQHLRPTSDGRRNVYHEDYDFVHPIAQLGRDTDTSIMLVHHLNKLDNGDELDKVSGSTGLTGAVENVMILDRARGESKATLSIRPREGQEEDFTVEFDGHVLTWTVGRQHYEPKSKMRQAIYDFLRDAEQSTLGNIAEAVGKGTDSVSKRLTEMKQNGAPIKKPQRGVYKIVSGAS